MGLIHHWKFDEAEPTTTYADEVGGNAATEETTATAGVASAAGLGTQVSLPDATARLALNSQVTVAAPFTLIAWVTVSSVAVHQYLLAPTTTTDYLRISAAGTNVRFKIGGVGPEIWNLDAEFAGANLVGQQVMFAFVKDALNDVRAYCNAIEQGAAQNNAGGSLKFNYLAGYTTPGSGFDGGGSLDDVRVYDSDETANLAAIYAAGITAPSSIRNSKIGLGLGFQF